MPLTIVPPAGQNRLLDVLLREHISVSRLWEIHLYVNNFTPRWATVTLADLVEASWLGYEPVPIDDALWTPAVRLGDFATSNYGTGPLSWTPTSPTSQIVFGYYVTDDVTGLLLWVQRFDANINPTITTPVLFRPTLQLQSLARP